MSSKSRNPEISFLRLDTSDLSSPQRSVIPHSGVMTPISSAYDGRRSSIASGWSFISQPVISSHPSSIASLQSSNGPTTPPSAGTTFDYTVCDRSGVSMGTQQLTPGSSGRMKAHLLPSPLPLQRQQLDDEPMTGFSESGHDWMYVSRNHESKYLRMPLATCNTMMPAASDFSTAMSARLAHTAASFASDSTMESFDWSRQDGSFSWPDHSTGAVSYGSVHAFDSDWETTPNKPWMSTSACSDNSTLVPRDTVMAHATYDESPYGYNMQPLHAFASPTSIDGSRRSNSAGMLTSEPEIEDEDGNFEHEIFVTKHGKTEQVKDRRFRENDRMIGGVKKEHRRSVRSSRKRVDKTERVHYHQQCQGIDIKVTTKLPMSTQEKHYCRFSTETGAPCTKSFARQEHLKRHEQTHSGERPYECVVCHRKFGRQDNKRDHFMTHLSESLSGRNSRIQYEEFCKLLRDNEAPEEAEKGIARLEKWRADGKHLLKRTTSQRKVASVKEAKKQKL